MYCKLFKDIGSQVGEEVGKERGGKWGAGRGKEIFFLEFELWSIEILLLKKSGPAMDFLK